MRPIAPFCGSGLTGRTFVAISFISATIVLPAAPARAAAPSFDCKKAEGQVQELVCGDAQLSALDRETMRLFSLAEDGKPKAADRKALLSGQTNWETARGNCASTTETRDCILAGYLRRIMELRGSFPAARSADRKGISLGPDNVTCDGLPGPRSIVFANTQTPLAYLSAPDEPLVLTLGPTGSGARYATTSDDGETVFWIKGRQAMFTLPDGKTHQCGIAEGN
jgi:uncharacterized protein